MAKRGTTKPKKMVGATDCFKIAAFRLLTHRAFVDYITALTLCRSVEPEHFVEDWVARFAPAMGKKEEVAFWGEFMYMMVERTKH